MRAAAEAGASTGGLLLGLAFLFLALLAAMVLLLGVLTGSQQSDVRILRRLSIYTLSGGGGRPVPVASQDERAIVLLGDSQFARRAVDVMGRVAQRRGLAGALDGRLEAAGLPLRSGEWLVLHLAAAVVATAVFLTVSGTAVGAVVGLVLGATAPWFLVMVRQGRRESAFLAQLPDTLQLIAGSLQAGYALQQSLDTIVREGRPPMSVEFNRALVETRLGVTAEDALEGIARRMGSADFSWVVMAIRIQREVGGNLAELLMTVAQTLRERERLRRQVAVLAAEGKLSAWILGALPVVFTVYLTLVRPEYIGLLVTSGGLGLGILLLAVVLLVVGAVWLVRIVRMEV